MTLGTSLFLIAVGAILRYAVTASVSGIDLQTVGVILMIVGVIGAIVSVVWMIMSSRRNERDVVTRDRRDVYY
jgi:Na+/melibiose symporter-like transporter